MSNMKNDNVCKKLTSTNSSTQDTVDSVNWFLEEAEKINQEENSVPLANDEYPRSK